MVKRMQNKSVCQFKKNKPFDSLALTVRNLRGLFWAMPLSWNQKKGDSQSACFFRIIQEQVLSSWSCLKEWLGPTGHYFMYHYRPHTIVWGKVMFSVCLLTGGPRDWTVGDPPPPHLTWHWTWDWIGDPPPDMGLDRGPPPTRHGTG